MVNSRTRMRRTGTQTDPGRHTKISTQSSRGGQVDRTTYAKLYKPSVSQWRVSTVSRLVLCAAFGLIAYDAYVSYQGFQKLQNNDHMSLIFAGFVFVTQLAIGVLHALGNSVNNMKSASTDDFLDDAWVSILRLIYGIDIMSNAVEFGILEGWLTVSYRPVEQIGASILVVAMALMLTFADEILLRLYDQISLASDKNRVFARKHRTSVKVHDKFLKKVEELASEKAEAQAQYEGNQWEFGDDL